MPRPLAPTRAMRSRTCADVFQPCRTNRERLTPSARSGATFGYEEVTGSMLIHEPVIQRVDEGLIVRERLFGDLQEEQM